MQQTSVGDVEPAPKEHAAAPDGAKEPGSEASAGTSAPTDAGAPTDAAAAEPAVVPLPESLVAVGIPAIPREIADGVGAYSEVRSARVLGWHPSESRLLIATRFADTGQVHEVREPGGARHQLTFFADGIDGAAYPPVGGGDFFVVAKDVGGDEFLQNWRFDRASGRLTLLTDGTSKNTLGPWSWSGDRFAYTSTRRTGKDTDLYVVDPSDPATDHRIAEVEGGGWWPLDWSPDDQKLLVERYVSVNESSLWLFDLEGGGRRQITPEAGDTPVAWGAGAFAADGRSVITISDADDEFRQLVRLGVDDGASSRLVAPIPWDVSSYSLSRDRKRLAAVVNAGGVSELHLYDLPSGRERAIKSELPAGVISSLSWHPRGRLLAFTLSSARSPADAYVLDSDRGTVERWTESEVGGLDPSAFAEPEKITWKSFDEREIPGFLYRPPATFAGKRPVIVLIHGGPEGQSRTGFITRNNYYLNELGVALIYPNVRGSTGYGKSYVKLDNGRLREDSVKDIGALLDWIATQPDLDAERVMIMGGSYGGYMTLASAVHYADRIRCAVDIVGISNFVTFLENTESYRRDLRRVEYGDERDPEMRSFLSSISPLTHADKIKKPLFVVQGRNDPRVPASEAEQIVATLQKTGTPIWYLEGKDEGHGFSKKRNQDYQMYATILFMKRYLLDGLTDG
ncbi:MAG: S9 family peptidase [Myxococcales bacterium]|nr:S9 family peptidase [Myxococcales bacterium]